MRSDQGGEPVVRESEIRVPIIWGFWKAIFEGGEPPVSRTHCVPGSLLLFPSHTHTGPSSKARSSSPGCGKWEDLTSTGPLSGSFSRDLQYSLGFGGKMEIKFQN